MLSESYRNRLKTLSGILNEKKEEFEYQIRDIGGDVFYKRIVGRKKWNFTTELDFYKNTNKKNTIKWENNDKKELRKETESEDVISFYKKYFENISPSHFKIIIKGDDIIIKNIKNDK
jgi:hypothetical protein